MQKRQAHTKSRRGCWPCKKGHVKCDESRPTCIRCLRRGHECDYSPFRHLRQAGPQTSVSIKPALEKVPPLLLPILHRGRKLPENAGLYFAHQANAMHPRGPNSRPANHLFELRLIQTFISGAETMQKSYQDGHHVQSSIQNIFQLAIQPKHWYLMDIILGVTAIGLRSTIPEDQALIEASHSYAVQSIQECSKQISEGICEANAEGLLVASLLIAMHAFTSQQYEDFAVDSNNVTGQIPLLPWLRQFQGVKAIRNAGWTWIQNSETIKPMLSALPAQAFLAVDPNAKGFFDFLLEDLDPSTETPETIAAYTASVTYMSLVMSEPDRHGLLGFPMSVSERFIELLEIRDPRSMTIIGSYLALMTLSRRSRYLIGAAKRDFEFIMATLPEEWLPRMKWAQTIFVLNEAGVQGGDAANNTPGISYLISSR